MRTATSAEPMGIEGKAALTTASTNSRPLSDLLDARPPENPRWRWNAREKKWNVSFLGYNWIIGKGEDDHVWFLADIHRLNLFTAVSKRAQ